MTTPRDVDVVVVGAGIVGVACAAEFARAGHSVLLLERGEDIARETTSLGSFVERMLRELEHAPDEAGRATLEPALEVGLAAYRGRELPVRGVEEA